MAAAGAELVAQPRDGHRSAHHFDTEPQRRPYLGGIIDTRRNLAQGAGLPQLVDDRGRDPQASRDSLNPGRLSAEGTQAVHQRRDAFLHLRIEPRLGLRQAQSPPAPREPAIGYEIVDYPPQFGIVELEWRGAAMTRWRSTCGGGPDARHERVHAEVDGQWLFLMEPAERGEREAFGNAPLLGVNRPDRHPGPVPDRAIRIASDSSSESWFTDAPASTGLAKMRVFALPCRPLRTIPSR